MSFSHVKQTLAWRDLESLPGAWDWTQADRILSEVERRELRLIVRLGQVPEWALTEGTNLAHDSPPADIADWQAYLFPRWLNATKDGSPPIKSGMNRISAAEWGDNRPDPAAYVELLAACSSAIRIADPAAVLISARIGANGQQRRQRSSR